GRSVRRIARGLKRSPSTVSREIRRNGGSQRYRANRADRSAWERALRPKPCRLALHRELFVQTRGVLKKELAAHLRTRRQMRLPKSHNAGSGQGHILDMVSIRQRPAEAEERAVPGHWEGDLLTGG